MKYYFSHKFNEFLVLYKNWKKDDQKDYWYDALSVLPNGSTAWAGEYRRCSDMPRHYQTVKAPDSKLIKIADSYNLQR